MVKKLLYICFSLHVFFDNIFKIITKRSILIWFNDFIQERSYKSIKILDKEIKFFVPNQLLEWLRTFFLIKHNMRKTMFLMMKEKNLESKDFEQSKLKEPFFMEYD